MSSRLEFVLLAKAPGANIRALCRAFHVSPKTAYKWLSRFDAQGADGLQEQSRRPHSSPARTSPQLEARVLALHETYPCWGGRKLCALLSEQGSRLHPSTIDAILRRHGRRIDGAADRSQGAYLRFEHPAPNLLWQMDFKGHFPLTDQRAGRCHALTVLDDHSRYSLCLQACGDETRTTVQAALTATFRRYGLPQRITADNGPPWGARAGEGLSRLEVWLIRLGVPMSHSRPYHPQTQGKDERFHRTLKRELLDRTGFHSLQACQAAFDAWRQQYNLIRPHEALGQKPPVHRYQASGRSYPEQLPSVEYEPGEHLLKVRPKGQVTYRGRVVFIGEGVAGEYVAIRPTAIDGVFAAFFCHKQIREIDLRDAV
jgi:transposase InsO family protein